MEKRQLKLSMKQLVPTGLGEYLLEHNEGDVVSGRVIDESGLIELGEGIRAKCVATAKVEDESKSAGVAIDLSQLSSMLKFEVEEWAVASG